jgi:predicted XRE-type DNA-binding protein
MHKQGREVIAMRITKQICDAIENLLRDKDYSEAQLAEKIGVAQRTVNSWKRGEVGSIKDCYWEKLGPMLRPYLPQQAPSPARSATTVSGQGNIVAGGDATGNHIALTSDDACAAQIEAFRAALIMDIIDLDIDAAAKDAILRLARNFRRP